MNTILKRMLIAMAALLGVLGLNAGFASAATQHSTFGQCGGTVFTGSQLKAAWDRMGVTGQAAHVAASAGFRSMDNSLSVFMQQRVVRVPLAQAASPVDFGCNPGQLFSVGPRLIPNGTPVMVVLPASLAKKNISTGPRPGFVRKMFTVHVIGKSNCSNPLNGIVKVWIWIKVKVKPKPAPKPQPKIICTLNGVPQFVQPSNTIINSQGQCVVQTNNCPANQVKAANGNCVNQSNAAENNCKVAGGTWNGETQLCTIVQINGNCSTIIYVNGNGNVVNTTSSNCNNSTPPQQTPQPTFQCSGLSLSASQLSATVTIGVSTTNGASFKSATVNWGDNNSTTDGLTQSHTYAAAGTFGVSAVVTFNLPNSTTATANCSSSITVSTPPPPPCKSSIVSVTTLNDVDAGGSSPTFNVKVSTCSGTTATLLVSARFGSFNSGQATTSGVNTYTFTYTAPGEVPQGDSSKGIPTGDDKITVTLLDSSGNVIDSDTQLVPINPPPPST